MIGAYLLSLLTFGAQVTPEPEHGACLSLTDLVHRSAVHDPRVALAATELAAAEADLDDALALRRPNIEAFGRSSVGDTGLTTSQIENQVGVRISQRVFDFGDAHLARTGARASRRAALEATHASAIDAAQEAVLTTIDLYAAAAQLDATEDRSSYFRSQLESVADLASRNLATGAELAEIEAELARSQATRIELELQRDTAAAALAIQLDQLAPRACDIAQLSEEIAVATGALGSAGEWSDAVVARNPTVVALREQIQADEALRRREARARLPALDLVGVASYAYDDARDEWDYRDRLGIDVSVPLYSGSALTARADRATARLESSRSQLRSAERQVRLQALTVQRQIRSTQAQIIRLEALEQSRAEQFEFVAQEVDRGVATLPRLVEVRLEYEAATLLLIEARFNLLRQRVLLLALAAELPGLPPPPELKARRSFLERVSPLGSE